MQIINYPLPLREYYIANNVKSHICIHHTQGRSAKSSIDWWAKDPERVGTAYVIDRDGIIYKAFDDANHAYQFGLKNNPRRDEIEKATIGIELANLGPINRLQNGTFSDGYGKPFTKQPFKAAPWRGYQYWEQYTDEQYQALKELLQDIAKRHDIKLSFAAHLDFDLSVYDKYTVFTHANVRRDKTDVSPAFDFKRIM
jgi:N-acetyl-anhydromuramyl-L-alanine amidase AmpD